MSAPLPNDLKRSLICKRSWKSYLSQSGTWQSMHAMWHAISVGGVAQDWTIPTYIWLPTINQCVYQMLFSYRLQRLQESWQVWECMHIQSHCVARVTRQLQNKTVIFVIFVVFPFPPFFCVSFMPFSVLLWCYF